MEDIKDIIYYSLEKAIKSYRQFAQRQISQAGLDITIDQWLILKTLQENRGISQNELAATVFKDVASITRIAELLVKKGYLKRDFHPTDRRRFELTVTAEGLEMINRLKPVVKTYRNAGLKGVNVKEIGQLNQTLKKIIDNTQ
jgi:MarR family transcriptional regulator for hemolysin